MGMKGAAQVGLWEEKGQRGGQTQLEEERDKQDWEEKTGSRGLVGKEVNHQRRGEGLRRARRIDRVVK
jgi:hypothetical protein